MRATKVGDRSRSPHLVSVPGGVGDSLGHLCRGMRALHAGMLQAYKASHVHMIAPPGSTCAQGQRLCPSLLPFLMCNTSSRSNGQIL